MQTKNTQKSLHYWAIHRRVMRRFWKDLPFRERDIIANDTEHRTEIYKWFEGTVKSETERLYNDPAAHCNDPFTFKESYS